MSGAPSNISIPLLFRGTLDAPGPAGHYGRMVDSHVERSLAAMQRDPARRWTVAELAGIAGLSRAPFARRFKRATGQLPHRYLTQLRLRRAATRLVATDARLAQIAFEVGYSNEFAFAKAFKGAYGVAPGAFRRQAWGRATVCVAMRLAA
jgi:transcriptional regulator GlxA family with amidase domain